MLHDCQQCLALTPRKYRSRTWVTNFEYIVSFKHNVQVVLCSNVLLWIVVLVRDLLLIPGYPTISSSYIPKSTDITVLLLAVNSPDSRSLPVCSAGRQEQTRAAHGVTRIRAFERTFKVLLFKVKCQWSAWYGNFIMWEHMIVFSGLCCGCALKLVARFQ